MCCSCGPNIQNVLCITLFHFSPSMPSPSLITIFELIFISHSILGIKEHMDDPPSKYLQSSYSSSSGLIIKSPKTQKMDEDEYDDDVDVDVDVEGEYKDQETTGGVLDKKKKTATFVVHEAGSGGGGGSGVMAAFSCQVDKCEADLTDSKKYHKRHKVCEVHAKAPVVAIAGSRQRFCQQCSRFHALTEFDDTKRSCRRRLAGHNERRRKSSSESRGESSSRRDSSQFQKENQCRQVDGREGSLSNYHIH